jgi:hypothetical protein
MDSERLQRYQRIEEAERRLDFAHGKRELMDFLSEQLSLGFRQHNAQTNARLDELAAQLSGIKSLKAEYSSLHSTVHEHGQSIARLNKRLEAVDDYSTILAKLDKKIDSKLESGTPHNAWHNMPPYAQPPQYPAPLYMQPPQYAPIYWPPQFVQGSNMPYSIPQAHNVPHSMPQVAPSPMHYNPPMHVGVHATPPSYVQHGTNAVHLPRPEPIEIKVIVESTPVQVSVPQPVPVQVAVAPAPAQPAPAPTITPPVQAPPAATYVPPASPQPAPAPIYVAPAPAYVPPPYERAEYNPYTPYYPQAPIMPAEQLKFAPPPQAHQMPPQAQAFVPQVPTPQASSPLDDMLAKMAGKLEALGNDLQNN